METFTEKDVFRLWWEYLKRSANYKEFCEWHRSRKGRCDLPPPDKFVKDFGSLEENPINYLYEIFLDLHADTYRGQPYDFEVWWKRQKVSLEKRQIDRERHFIYDYAELVQNDMQHVIQHLKEHEGRPPSFNDFKGYFVKQLRIPAPPRLFLEIDLTAEEIAPILKMINERILEERKGPRLRFWESFSDRSTWPKSLKDLALLKRFLTVYDLAGKGTPMAEIARKIGTPSQKANYNDENVQGVFEDDVARANKIIKNIELGAFPGNYDLYA